jgi:copper resistance protein D
LTAVVVAALAWRFLHFAALAVLFGGALFRLHAVGKPVADESAAVRAEFDRWLWRLLIVAAAIALISACGWLVAVAQTLTGSLAEALSVDGLTTILTETQFGQVWAWRLAILAALVLFLVFTGRRGNLARPGIAILAGISLASLSGVGHAVMGSDLAGVAHEAADAIHLFAGAAWLGGLVALLRVETYTGPDALALTRHALPRFSTVALVAVGLIVVTGIVNTAFIIESPAALLATGYGRVLLAKVMLFAGMVALGALNRYVFQPALMGADPAKGLRGLRLSVAAEIALGALVMAIVAALGMLSPSL